MPDVPESEAASSVSGDHSRLDTESEGWEEAE